MNKEMEEEIFVVLPVCTELQHDIFLNILKNVVGRSKLDTHLMDRAFIHGMKGPSLSYNSNDFNCNWSDEKSATKQMFYAKLLGSWAAHNFPSLGRKLFGEKWLPRQRDVLVRSTQESNIQEMYNTILKKLALRVVQLNVSPSTAEKLKHFVRVPANICDGNGLCLSKKMVSFGVHCSQIANCWKALATGNFISTEHLDDEVIFSKFFRF